MLKQKIALLIISNNDKLQEKMSQGLQRYEVKIERAITLAGASIILEHSRPFHLIAVDGSVPTESTFDGTQLCRFIMSLHEQYRAQPIVAVAESSELRRMMMAAGCSDDTCAAELPEKVVDLLRL